MKPKNKHFRPGRLVALLVVPLLASMVARKAVAHPGEADGSAPRSAVTANRLMKRFKMVLAAALVSSAALLVSAPSAVAADTTCVGLLAGTFDNVVVPPGAACTLTSSVVRGNVKALQDSQLIGSSNTVHGSVLGDKAEVVHFNFSTVRENIDIHEGERDDFGRDVDLLATTITEGNVSVTKMTGDIDIEVITGPLGNVFVQENVIAGFLQIDGSQIGQNLQVFKNTGPGAKRVQANTVGANLQCFENAPPFVGGPNTAAKAEGQCF